MGDWSEQSKPELVEMCRVRELPVSGTKEELIARLSLWELQQVAEEPISPDDEDGYDLDNELLPPGGDDDDEDDDNEQPEVVEDASATSGPPPEGLSGGLYRKAYPVPSTEVADSRHMELIAATHEAATQEGLRTRGAPWAGHRVGFKFGDLGLMAIYEVSARGNDAVG